MDFDAARRGLASRGARETALDMMYAPEFTTYELAEGGIVCVTLDRPLKAGGRKVIVKLTVCRDASKPKAECVYEEVVSLELK
jgi:hypothetical protein